jgi:RNA polymerase sigma-70 factor (ECF subfamily)
MIFLPLLFAVYIPEEDRSLAERLKRHEPAVMTELYDRYGKLAYSLIYRIVRDVGAAEDLVQETFLRVWNRAQGFDAERGALGPWLLAVARNRAIDYLRSASGKMSRGALELEAAEHPSAFVNFEADVLSQDQSRRVRSALGRLNENQRHVIELAYFEGLSQSEMAERLGQPLGTVKTWVRTALKNLRADLGEKALSV